MTDNERRIQIAAPAAWRSNPKSKTQTRYRVLSQALNAFGETPSARRLAGGRYGKAVRDDLSRQGTSTPSHRR